jgi:hypothetical protein
VLADVGEELDRRLLMEVNMIGLYIFGVVILAGLVTLIVVKARWARQASRTAARYNSANR